VAADGELTGENRAQIGHGAALCRRAIDVGLGAEGEVLPEHFQHADQTQRDSIRVQMRLGGVDYQPLDELAHQRRKALVLLSANIVIFLA
jgi:hypothetical protein